MQLALSKDIIVEKNNNNAPLIFESDNYFKTEKEMLKDNYFKTWNSKNVISKLMSIELIIFKSI